MAKQSKQPLGVTCSICGTSIMPSGTQPIPVNYLWRNGKVYCWECVKAGKVKEDTKP